MSITISYTFSSLKVFKAWYLVLSLSLLTGLRASAQLSDFYWLEGEATNKEVRLMFLPEKWPVGLEGFIVGKRKGSSGSWIFLQDKPIPPGFSKEKDFNPIVTIPERKAYLQRLNSQYFTTNKLFQNEGKAFIEKYQAQAQPRPQVRGVFYSEYDRALLAGLGFNEAAPEDVLEWEYGLFYVIAGKRSVDAVAIWRPKDNFFPPKNVVGKIENFSQRYDTTAKSNKHLIVWRMKIANMEANRWNSFKVYVQLPDGKLEPQAAGVRLPGNKLPNDPKTKEFSIGKRGQPDKPYTWVLEPQSFFGNPGEHIIMK